MSSAADCCNKFFQEGVPVNGQQSESACDRREERATTHVDRRPAYGGSSTMALTADLHRVGPQQ